MRIVKGDLFLSGAPAIGHGVNCRGVMGAGIAKVFRAEYPEMYQKYKSLCERGLLTPGNTWPWQDASGLVIYNMASQDEPGANARLEWLARTASRVLVNADARKFDRVAIPQIGCGIGGLEWDDVEEVLLEAEKGANATYDVHVL